MVMVHADNVGLVLPPKVAEVQIIVIPMFDKNPDFEAIYAIFAACSSTVRTLRAAGFRVEHDFREIYSVAWKFYDWERKGVPLRIEIKPECMAENQVQIVRRDNRLKEDVPMKNLVEHVRDLLSDIHKTMFNVAKKERCLYKDCLYTGGIHDNPK
ncbi:hypothetical protein KSP40_PGU018603 [Platanthera guangdongensis]|uniref:Anticodon-binding domain-containing protein n=1 Tax=Platanthera guangdongensis TaxID=2320717 RepID=A0ABR2MAT7_9ASPA